MTMTQGHKLREILERPGILVLPGIYDCIGAKLIEQLGFEVVFTSGFGISGSTLGRPDFGFLTATETLYSVGRIAHMRRKSWHTLSNWSIEKHIGATTKSLSVVNILQFCWW